VVAESLLFEEFGAGFSTVFQVLYSGEVESFQFPVLPLPKPPNSVAIKPRAQFLKEMRRKWGPSCTNHDGFWPY
jgi:hypothetical protein